MPEHKSAENTSFSFDPTILREYDIRGIVGETLNIQDAYMLGKAFGTYAIRNAGRRICVGYDGRLTSPELVENLMKGLIEVGCRVRNIGLGPTPYVYFATKDRLYDAGIMITGSHNPSEYNGFKMTLQKEGVFGETIQEIGRIAAEEDFHQPKDTKEEKGLDFGPLDLKEEYIDRLLRDLTTKKELKIAWDCGNGATGELVTRLVEKLPGEHIVLFGDIDGTFPNHHPDPSVDKNLEDLISTVVENDYDLGIAFDGDGDRIGVVDEKGQIIRSDILLTIYAREVLLNRPNAPIIGDVKCSSLMFEEIGRLGGRPVMWKTGHSLVKSKMAELNAPLAGELSGHIFFADKYYGFDDALYCAIRLINELGELECPLSDLTKHLPSMFDTPEIRIEVDETKKMGIVQTIQQKLEETYQFDKEIDVNTVDGVRVNTKDGWWLMRASNTQNALVARIESTSQNGLDDMYEMMNSILSEFDLSLPSL